MGTARIGSLGALVAKGDILAFDGESLQRVPAGSNGQSLVIDSTQPLGFRWETSTVVINLIYANLAALPVPPPAPNILAIVDDIGLGVRGLALSNAAATGWNLIGLSISVP